MRTYQQQIDDLLANREAYHERYYAAKTFRGPSLYFHRRALEMADEDYGRSLEYIYAVLVSWGMHTMGANGPKMREFEVFRAGMEKIESDVRLARQIQPSAMTEADWGLLERIFKGVDVMETGARLVGNSKVMAHLLPNIIPPIDRSYTLTYLHGHMTLPSSLDGEWRKMRRILAGFFIPVAMNPGFRARAEAWVADQKAYPWDTSVMKVIDNLVIGAVKYHSAAEALGAQKYS